MMAFGPVPSRRLGQSLGINHVPPKVCTYSCVYCQLGKTIEKTCKRKAFNTPSEVIKAVKQQIEKAHERKERVDYLTFVPDGEPTLDIDLGREIKLCKPLGIKVAVISNGSLIWREDVRSALTGSDWVSLKIDAITEEVWRKVNRPHGRLKLDEIFEGMSVFRKIFDGELTTETMLIRGLNDTGDEMEKVADFLVELNPDKVYIAIPTRPPSEAWVMPADEEAVNRTYQIFNARVKHVEYLIGFEGNAFAFTGNVVDDLLNITSVHPMREESVKELLSSAETSWEIVERLIDEEKLIEMLYMGHKFYMRKLPSRMKQGDPRIDQSI